MTVPMPSSDLLSGVAEISDFLGKGFPRRRVYYLLENGRLPAFKLGNKWTARRSTLVSHFEKLEKGAA